MSPIFSFLLINTSRHLIYEHNYGRLNMIARERENRALIGVTANETQRGDGLSLVLYISTYTHTDKRICSHTETCIRVRTNIWHCKPHMLAEKASSHISTYMHEHAYECKIYIDARIHTYMHTHTHAHTHIHAHTYIHSCACRHMHINVLHS